MNINVGDMLYITLKKKDYTLTRLAEELTKQQEILGYKGTILKSNLSSKFTIRDGEAGVTPELARRIEIILDLPKYSLVDMCPKRSREAKSQIARVKRVDELLGKKEDI